MKNKKLDRIERGITISKNSRNLSYIYSFLHSFLKTVYIEKKKNKIKHRK